jgi:hypothetical protein
MRSGCDAAGANQGPAPEEIEMPHSSSPEPKAEESFAELLRELPAENDFVTLVGVVTCSPKEGHFRLTPPGGGQPLELPVEAVHHHAVLRHEHGHLLAQLEVARATAEPLLEEYLVRNPVGITIPSRTYLTGVDWVTDLQYWPKIVESVNQYDAEWTRQALPGDPVRQVAGGLAPFVLATPHHAPAAPLAMQAAGFHPPGGFKAHADPPKPILDPILKHGYFDNPFLGGLYGYR